MTTLYDSSNLTATKILEKHAVFNHSLLNRSLRVKKQDSKAYIEKSKSRRKDSLNSITKCKSIDNLNAFNFGYDYYYEQKMNQEKILKENQNVDIDLNFKKLNETFSSLYS